MNDKPPLLDLPLDQVQAELRSGKGDPRRRQALWLTLDHLVAEKDRNVPQQLTIEEIVKDPVRDNLLEPRCWCGKVGSFGVGVFLRQDKEGKWFCREHAEAGGFVWPKGTS